MEDTLSARFAIVEAPVGSFVEDADSTAAS